MKEYRNYLCYLVIFSLLLFLSPSCSFSQEGDEEELYPPVEPPDESSILMTVDFLKSTRNFAGEQVILRFPSIREKIEEEYALIKEAGYSSVEITIGNNFKELCPDESASPSLPESYDFNVLDEKISKARENGMTIAIILEISDFPPDISRYSSQAESVLKHLLGGWAGGFRLNEKDLSFIALSYNPENEYWADKEEDMLRLYSLFAGTVKKMNPGIPVGGLGFTTVFKSESQFDFSESNPQYSRFFEYLKTRKLPLDILLLRHRGMMPYGYFLTTRTCDERILKGYDALSPLFGKPRITCSAEILPSGASPLLEGTVCANALSCLIKGGAHYAMIPFEVRETNAYFFILKNINRYGEHPVQLETIGLDRMCLTLTAMKSKDGKKAAFIVCANNPSLYLIENPSGRDRKAVETEYRKYVDIFEQGKKFSPLYTRYRLHVENLPWEGKSVQYRRYIIDSTRTMECIEEKTLQGTKVVYVNKTMTIPSLQIITLEEMKEEKK